MSGNHRHMPSVVISAELLEAITEHDEEALHQGDDEPGQWEYQDMVMYVQVIVDTETDNYWESRLWWEMIEMGKATFDQGRARGFRTESMTTPYFHGELNDEEDDNDN